MLLNQTKYKGTTKLTLEKGTAYFDDFQLKFILLILVLRMPAVWSGISP